MIGDWVVMKDKPYKIASLSNIENPELENDKYIFHCLKDEIVPILLTPEILEENGFKCEEIIQSHWISEDGRILLRNDEWIINSNNKWLAHFDNEDMQTIGCFELTYVHELQHALRLCNINKKIEV